MRCGERHARGPLDVRGPLTAARPCAVYTCYVRKRAHAGHMQGIGNATTQLIPDLLNLALALYPGPRPRRNPDDPFVPRQ